MSYKSIILTITLATSVLSSGCTSQGPSPEVQRATARAQRFHLAKEKDTISAWSYYLHYYQQYANEENRLYANNRYKELVQKAEQERQKRITEERNQEPCIVWRKVRDIGTPDAIEEYLKKYTKGVCASEARMALDSYWRRFVKDAKAGKYPIKVGKSLIPSLLDNGKLCLADLLQMKGLFETEVSRFSLRSTKPEAKNTPVTDSTIYSFTPNPAMRIVSSKDNSVMVTYIHSSNYYPQTLHFSILLNNGEIAEHDIGFGYAILQEGESTTVYEWLDPDFPSKP